MNRNQQNKILVTFSVRDVSVYAARAPAVKVVKMRDACIESHSVTCIFKVVKKLTGC